MNPPLPEKFRHRILYSHVLEREAGMTLADYMTQRFSRFDFNGWSGQILAGKVLLNRKQVPPEIKVRQHDLVEYFPPETPEPEADLNYTVVYEDEYLLVFDKPANLCVHPTGPLYRNTLWYHAAQHWGELRFVNRLDRETSGLVMAARDKETAVRMNSRSFFVRKEYLALVFGTFDKAVRAKGLLVPDPDFPPDFRWTWVPCEDRTGDKMFTDTELIPEGAVPPEGGYAPEISLVRAILHTGKRHQIRATLCSLGFPLVGDKLYGRDPSIQSKVRTCQVTEEDMRKLGGARQALHSAVLKFTHPYTNRTIRLESPFHYQLLPEPIR